MQIGSGICIFYEHPLVTLTQVTLLLAMYNIRVLSQKLDQSCDLECIIAVAKF